MSLQNAPSRQSGSGGPGCTKGAHSQEHVGFEKALLRVFDQAHGGVFRHKQYRGFNFFLYVSTCYTGKGASWSQKTGWGSNALPCQCVKDWFRASRLSVLAWLCCCTFMCMCLSGPGRLENSQWALFSPSTIWGPGTELSSPHLAPGAYTCWVIMPDHSCLLNLASSVLR